MINISHKNAEEFIASYRDILEFNSEATIFIKSLFLYATALYIVDLLDPAIYKRILNTYRRKLSDEHSIGLQPRFIPHLLNYIDGKYHENHVRSFKSIVIKQYRNLVPAFDYYIDQDAVHNHLIKLVRSEAGELFHTLIMAYYDDNLTLAELSLICGSLHSEVSILHPHISNAALILPVFYFNPMQALDLRDRLFRYIKDYILQYESITIDYDIDLNCRNCPKKGYRWVNDVIADFSPHAPPFIVKEMISHVKEGYVFGRPQGVSIDGYVGLYAKKR